MTRWLKTACEVLSFTRARAYAWPRAYGIVVGGFLLASPAFAIVTDQRVPTASDNPPLNTWTLTVGSTWYDAVDDPVATPNDADYVTYTPDTGSGRITFTFPVFAVPSDAISVSSVAVYWRHQDAGAAANNVGPVLKVNGTYYTGSTVDPGAAFTTSNSLTVGTTQWTTNPKTGAAWTINDVNGVGTNPIQAFGVHSNDGNPDDRVSQVYLEVSYVPEATAPSAVTNLSALRNSTAGVLNLSWTSPGDSGTTGAINPGTFRIFYSTVTGDMTGLTATTSTTTTRSKVDISTSSVNPGTTEYYTFQNLYEGNTYYMRIFTADEVPNWSTVSNSCTAYTSGTYDVTAPSALTDLSALQGPIVGSVRLNWTAPGDDGGSGTFTQGTYRIFRSSVTGDMTTLTLNSSASTTLARQDVTFGSASPGQAQSFNLANLTSGTTYFVRIFTADEAFNWSSVSNSATAYAMTTSTNTVYRSVGITATDLNTSARTAQISGLTASFSGSMPDNMGVGDVLQYQVSGTTYLAFVSSRTSSSIYTVNNSTGGIPQPAVSGTAVSVYRAYTSLSNWEAQTENTTINDTVENFDTSTDIVAGARVMMVACYGDGADTANVVVQGWTTSAPFYIKIFTPFLPGEVGTSQRHTGKWTTGAYRLEYSGSAVQHGLQINGVDFVTMEGLQVFRANSSNATDIGVQITNTGATSVVNFSHGIIKGDAAGTGTNYYAFEDFNFNVGSKVKIWNSIIYDFTGTASNQFGLQMSGTDTMYAYNVLVSSTNTGLVRGSGTFVVKNVITRNCPDGFNGTFTSSDYNSSDISGDAPVSLPRDNTVSPSYSGAQSAANFFVDQANKDFHLNSAAVVINSGTDLSADATIPFNTDINGNTRPGTWDLGPDEFGSSDQVAPSALTNLSGLSGSGTGKINLSWTAPGDNGTSGTITTGSFRVFYSTVSGDMTGLTATSNTTTTLLKVDISTSSVNPSTTQYYTLQSLYEGNTYYMRAFTADDVNNWSSVSNSATTYASGVYDNTAPSAVTDLTATQGVLSGSLRLTWTTPGDDGASGAFTQGTFRIFRSSVTSDITGLTVNSAPTSTLARQDISFSSVNPGTLQVYDYSNLTAGTTYFARIFTADEVLNWSSVSNSATAYATNSSTNTVYRSVGITATDLNTSARTVGITGLSATFSGSMPNNIGVGDVLQYQIASTYYLAFISSRTSSTIYTVTNSTGGIAQPVSAGTAVSVYRAYTKLADWVALTENTNFDNSVEDFDTSANLVTSTRIVMVACYGDGADTTSVPLSGWTTSATYFIKIFTPVTPGEVGVSQRHTGKWTSGAYSLEYSGTANNYTMRINAVNFVTLDGLQIYRPNTTNATDQGMLVDTLGVNAVVNISNCILKGDAQGAGSQYLGLETFSNNAAAKVKIWNTAVYDFKGSATTQIGLWGDGTGTLYTYNVTVTSCAVGIQQSAGTVTAFNSITRGCPDGFNGTFTASDYNSSDISGDAPLQAPRVNTNSPWYSGAQSASNFFVDEPNDDFHLNSNSVVINNGTNLSADANVPFSNDIDNQDRAGLWDLGIDETPDAAAPSAVTNLSGLSGAGSGNINLSWTSPGDDVTTGTLNGTFRIFHSTVSSDMTGLTATTSATSTMARVDISTSSVTPATTRYYALSNLLAGGTYYIRVFSADEVPNWSAVSNSCTQYAGAPDLVAPSAITNLSALPGSSAGTINLSWTSPGDDGTSGALTGSFRIFHSTVTGDMTGLTATASATSTLGRVDISTSSVTPATTRYYTVPNLLAGSTYFLRIFSSDDVTNWSAVSNSATNYATPINCSSIASNATTGNWSNPLSWTPAAVPGSCNAVTIAAGHTITLDIDTAISSTTIVNGTLKFSRVASSTHTLTASLTVNGGGTIDMGTEADTIPTSVKANLVLAQGTSAGQYSLTVNSGGNFLVRGATVTPYAVSVSSAAAGATGITVAAANMTGWAANDFITIGKTQNNTTDETERRAILNITGTDPKTITWTGGLTYNHYSTNTIVVQNLTRNVVVKSSHTTNTAYIYNLTPYTTSFTLNYGEFANLGNSAVNKYGITLNVAGTKASISNCAIHDNYRGIDIENTSGVTLSNNAVYKTTHYGMLLLTSTGNTISGNAVSSAGNIGIIANTSADNNIFSGNYSYSHVGGSYGGIYINNSSSNTITGNTLSGIQGPGIILNNTSPNCTVTNNLSLNNNGSSGISLGSSAPNTLVSSNTCRSNSQEGIRVAGANNIIKNNTVYGNTLDGIYVTGASANNNTLLNNTIYSNAGNGLRFTTNSGAIGYGNASYSNTSAGSRGIYAETNVNNTVLIRSTVYSNAATGFLAIASTATLVDSAIGYDSTGSPAANTTAEVTFTAGQTERITLKNTRINTLGVATSGIDQTSDSLISYNQDYDTGTIRLWGQYDVTGSTLTLDDAAQLYASTATIPKIMRRFAGTDPVVSVPSTDDTNAVSEIITLTYDGNWDIDGSLSGSLGSFSSPITNQPYPNGVTPKFYLTFSEGSTPTAGDVVDFAVIAASKDSSRQKKLYFGPSASGLNSGRSKLVVAPDAGFKLIGTASSGAVMDRLSASTTYYTIVSSGAFTMTRSTATNMDDLGLQLNGSGGVSISSSTFDYAGQGGTSTSTYITTRDLSSSATFYNLIFHNSRTSTNLYNVRVTATTKPSWYMQQWDGARGGESFDDDATNNITWGTQVTGDVTAPSAVTNLSALTSATQGALNLSWTAPGDDGTTGALTGTFRVFSSTVSSDMTGLIATTSPTSTLTKVDISTSSVNPGTTEYYTLTGLISNVSYYLRIFTGDEIPNWSSISNGATAQTGAGITWTGTTDSNWNTATNWNTGKVPLSTNDITIPNTTNKPTLNAATTVNSLNISQTGARLDLGGYNLTVSTYVTLVGTMTASGTELITVGGNWDMSSGGYTTASSTVVFNGASGTQSIITGGTGAGHQFYNLTVNTSGAAAQLAGHLAVNGELTVTAGTLNTNAAGSYGVTVTSNVIINGGTFTVNASTVGLSRDWIHTSGTFNAGTSTVTFSVGVSTIDVPSTETFASLEIAKNDGVNFIIAAGDTVTATGTLTLTDGNVITGTLESQGALIHGALFDGGTAQLLIDGNTSRTITLTSGGQLPYVILNATNVVVNSSASGTVTIDSGLNIYAGQFAGSAGDIDLNQSFILYGGTMTAPTGSFTVARQFLLLGGKFDHNTSTVTLDSSLTTSPNIQTLNGDPLYNFVVSKPGVTTGILAGSTVTVQGKLTLSSNIGLLSNGAVFAYGDVTISSNFGGGTTPLYFKGSSVQILSMTSFYDSFDGNVFVDKTGGRVDLASNGGFDGTANNQVFRIVEGTFNQNGRTFQMSGAGAQTIVESGGNFMRQGSETFAGSRTLMAGSTVTYTGTAASYNLGNYSYSDLVIDGGPSTQFNLNGNLTTIDELILNNSTTSLNGFALTANTLTNNATLVLRGTETVTITNMDTDSGTVEYRGHNIAANVPLKDFGTNDYYNLTINDTNSNRATFQSTNSLRVDGNMNIVSGQWDGNGYGITIAGDWTNAGTFTPNASAVTFLSSNPQTVDQRGQSFSTVVSSNTSGSGLTFSSSFTATNFIINAGGLSSRTTSYFAGNSTFTITNFLVNGNSSFPVVLKSTDASAYWYLNNVTTNSVSYVQAQRSDASSGQTIRAGPTSTNLANSNINWNFTNDITAPAAITNLSAMTGSAAATIRLTWTAPGDDGSTGTATAYTIKRSTNGAISSDANWNNGAWSVALDSVPIPSPTGSNEVWTVTGLLENQQYWFAIKSQDEVPNVSSLNDTSAFGVAVATSQVTIISITVDTGTYNFGAIAANISTVSTQGIVVTNNGTVSETYRIKAATTTANSPWVLNSAPGNDQINLRAGFHAAQPAPGAFGSEDTLTTSDQTSSSSLFSIDASQTGTTVPMTQTRKLWFLLKTPLSSSTTDQQDITVTISADTP